MKTYEFDTWAAFKKFTDENLKTLKADDKIIVHQAILEDGETTTTLKVIIPYYREDRK